MTMAVHVDYSESGFRVRYTVVIEHEFSKWTRDRWLCIDGLPPLVTPSGLDGSVCMQ